MYLAKNPIKLSPGPHRLLKSLKHSEKILPHDGDYQAALPEVRQYLEDYVYEKIWAEMSSGDRKLAYGVAKSEGGKAKEIKKILSLADNEYSPYRDRLVKRGILIGEEYGRVRFSLPMFEEYVIRNYD